MNWLRKAIADLERPSVLGLIAAAIVLNIVGGEVIAASGVVWVYGDSVGTMLAGMLGGPWIGGVTGLLSNVVYGATIRPSMLYFTPTAVVIGVLAGAFARRGAFHALSGAIVHRAPIRLVAVALAAGACIGVVAAIVSTPIALFVFGGLTGGPTDILVAIFRQYGVELWKAVAGQSIVSDPLDKAVTAMLALSIASALPRRTVATFPQGALVLDEPADTSA